MDKIVSSSERCYDIDWIRIGLIFSVFLFHIGMFFNGFGWHIKNNDRVLWLNPIMAYLHIWRMPLIFMVSGVGTYFALGHRNMGQFIGERSRRLLIPLVFAMFVIVPPQVFAEKHEQYGTYLNFIPHITEGSYPEGNFSWHHMWFVLYLFICAMSAIPFIVLLRSRFGTRIYNLFEKVSRFKGSFLLLAVPLFLSQIWLLRYFPDETHALVDDWAYITYNFLFFLYGYILLSNSVLISNITQQRRIYLIVAASLTGLFFYDYFYNIDTFLSNEVQLFLKCSLEFSMALTIIGYAVKYINHDKPIRKHLNEAIYPFYILHQTVIIIIGFFLYEANMYAGLKALILTFGSFFSCVAIYYFLIRPYVVTRFLFGMHPKQVKKRNEQQINDQQLNAA